MDQKYKPVFKALRLREYTYVRNRVYVCSLFPVYLCRQAVLIQAVLLLVAPDASQLGEAEAAADSGQFGLSRWCHCFPTTDVLFLMN